ncbi:MAG: treY [Ilumatobacteraceae bacterium]|nr:treY [Ilumatobacteraceae bacterium]
MHQPDSPLSTYRFQVLGEFTLHDVAGVADYVRQLGVDWLYLSPLLKAEAGSEHGYDVVDHSQIDPARGGAAGLDAVAAIARQLQLGILVDIVPNHVGVASAMDSVWWRDLLTNGQSSRYAEAFDVDWAFGGGRIRIPVLGDEDSPELEIGDGALHYGDLTFPIAPGTADEGEDAITVLSRQHYELVSWRRADADLNYRRFFAVNTLAGIRVEEPWVFDESHLEIVRWIRDGLVNGLRVDHPDGLADPGDYLDKLATATDRTYVLVEKILQRGEALPSSWAVAGTTGYDALAEIDRVLIDPGARASLNALDSQLREDDEPASWDVLIHDTKRAVADGILRSETRRIVRDLPQTLAFQNDEIEDTVAELLACFPVYRSYLPLGAEHLDDAAMAAKKQRPELTATIEAVVEVLGDVEQAAARRFQQTSGMVMAKGVEDTAFYRYSKLGSLTEVGGDPSQFSLSIDEFHQRQQLRQASFPSSQTTLSTHDTKRGEDVRARLHVLAELPREWRQTLTALREAVPLGDGSLEQLLWQAVIGAWPASRDRLHAYAEKAAREAGRSTTWAAPSPEFEATMHAAIDAVFDDPAIEALVGEFVDTIAVPGWMNSLSAKLLQLTAPGVPDVYQGSELWETSLVDPDNRRPIDFELRRRLLNDIDGGWLPSVDATGAAKLLVTARSLRLRRSHPEWFSRYAPVTAVGPASDHVVAFDRGEVTTVATRLPVGLDRSGGWQDTRIVVTRRPLIDVISGRTYEGGEIELAGLLDRYPVALLAPSDAELE